MRRFLVGRLLGIGDLGAGCMIGGKLSHVGSHVGPPMVVLATPVLAGTFFSEAADTAKL